MKIAVWHNLPSGGGKRALYDHVQGLVERGHVVESWCPSTADQTYLPLSDMITEHVLPFSWQPVKANTRVSRLASQYQNIVSQIKAMDEHCRQCAEEINLGQFDLLFANSCQLFRVTSIGRYVNIPKLLYLQEPYRWLYESMPQLPWLAIPPAQSNRRSPQHLKEFVRDLVKVQGLRVQAREELTNARAFDAILVNSFFSRESILRAYGLDAKVCYLGIDNGKFNNQQRKKDAFVVGIGAIVREKNIAFVIEALAKVPHPRPRLVWIGNYVDKYIFEELSQLAASVEVDFATRIRISDDEIVATLNQALMMVYAPRLEPFGFAPLEANACGLPVVAVAEGGVRETVIDQVNGLLVEHDARAMAEAIQRLMDDEAYARQLGQNGCDLVAQKWAQKAAIDRLESRFAEVVGTNLPAE